MTGDEIPYAYLLWSYPYLQRTRIHRLPLPGAPRSRKSGQLGNMRRDPGNMPGELAVEIQ